MPALRDSGILVVLYPWGCHPRLDNGRPYRGWGSGTVAICFIPPSPAASALSTTTSVSFAVLETARPMAWSRAMRIAAHVLVLGHHQHLDEEAVEHRREIGHAAQAALVVARRGGLFDVGRNRSSLTPSQEFCSAMRARRAAT